MTALETGLLVSPLAKSQNSKKIPLLVPTGSFKNPFINHIVPPRASFQLPERPWSSHELCELWEVCLAVGGKGDKLLLPQSRYRQPTFVGLG